MCHKSCLDFGEAVLKNEFVKNKSVIEVGSMDVGGSLRKKVELLGPSSYIGIDMQMGPGVDRICKAEDLVAEFGAEKFDLLICTELLEHVVDWQVVIRNLKQILKPQGVLFITTRSKGLQYHGYPFDYWRYEVSDMKRIFSDFEILVLDNDPQMPGVLFLARKLPGLTDNDFTKIDLYSVILKSRVSVKTGSSHWKIRMIRGMLSCLKLEGDRVYYLQRTLYYFKYPLRTFKKIKELLGSIF